MNIRLAVLLSLLLLSACSHPDPAECVNCLPSYDSGVVVGPAVTATSEYVERSTFDALKKENAKLRAEIERLRAKSDIGTGILYPADNGVSIDTSHPDLSSGTVAVHEFGYTTDPVRMRTIPESRPCAQGGTLMPGQSCTVTVTIDFEEVSDK